MYLWGTELHRTNELNQSYLKPEILNNSVVFSFGIALFYIFSLVANVLSSTYGDFDLDPIAIAEVCLERNYRHTGLLCLLLPLPCLIFVYQQSPWSSLFMLKECSGHCVFSNVNIHERQSPTIFGRLDKSIPQVHLAISNAFDFGTLERNPSF